MANRNISNTFLQWCKGRKNSNDNTDSQESHSRESGSSHQSRILDIERAERAKWASLTQQAERLCASQQAHSNAVLQRLGLSVQQSTLPSPQPPASPRHSPESSLRRGRLRPLLNMEDNNCSQTSRTNQMLHEEDPVFEKKHLGSQMATLACTLEKRKAKHRSPTPDASTSSADTQPHHEIHPTVSPTPPQTSATRRASRLPVITGGADKKVVAGYKLQSAKPKLEEIMKTFELIHVPSPQPPATPRRVTFIPTPPSAAAPTNRRGPRRGTSLRPSDNSAVKHKLQPSDNTSQSLSFCFRQLKSEDWEKKMEGLETVRDLTKHHTELLQTKLHEICLAVTDEVKSLHSAVACSALDTVAELHIHLGKAMDPEAERTGHALLLRLAQTTSAFIHQHANRALDALVEGCSPSRVMSVLLNTGLSHRCAAVRGSTAQHLHQLMNIVGEDRILAAGKIFAERFVTAVCAMSVDAAPGVRHYGQEMLQGLAQHKEFKVLWKKIIPVNDRPALVKILKKMRQ